MTASFDLPRLSDPGRHVRAALGPQQIRTARDLAPGALQAAAVWRLDDDGRVEGQRRDTLGPQWHRLTPALVRDWSRELGVGVDPVDPYAPRITDDPQIAEQIADEVAALVRAAPTGTRPLAALTPAAALARRLTRTRELSVERGRLMWRLRERDPVRGGLGREPQLPDVPVNAPAGLLGRLRRRESADEFEPVTAAAVEHVVRHGGYVASHEPAPSYPDVLAELGRLAGLAPSAPAASPDAGPGTNWLRRNTS